METKKISITLKTSVVTGTIILLFLAASSFISINLQSSLADLMIDRFVKIQKSSLEQESAQLKASLGSNMTVNLQLSATVTRSM